MEMSDIEIIETFTDPDWAGSKTNRRSTTGYCALDGGNLVSWKSKTQSVVALSSSEADYSAMARGTCELLWLKTLMRELGFVCKKPMLTMLDIFPRFMPIMRGQNILKLIK